MLKSFQETCRLKHQHIRWTGVRWDERGAPRGRLSRETPPRRARGCARRWAARARRTAVAAERRAASSRRVDKAPPPSTPTRCLPPRGLAAAGAQGAGCVGRARGAGRGARGAGRAGAGRGARGAGRGLDAARPISTG